MQYIELHGGNVGKEALPTDSPRASFLVVDPEEHCYLHSCRCVHETQQLFSWLSSLFLKVKKDPSLL